MNKEVMIFIIVGIISLIIGIIVIPYSIEIPETRYDPVSGEIITVMVTWYPYRWLGYVLIALSAFFFVGAFMLSKRLKLDKLKEDMKIERRY